ncbi:MAG: EamA family transporter RarD [Betaproteobacteria bacterium]
MNRGVLYALGAYLLWGLFPIYFKLVAAVPALEILAHRIAWSLLLVLGLLGLRRDWRWVGALARQPQQLRWFIASAALVSVNWGLYIWAVNAQRVVDASLGYFINPLVNVAIGALLLHERLRPAQWVAVAIAGAGVAWLTATAGAPPWIGLVLAFSFAGYGLLRKQAPLGAMEGFALEVTLLFPLAAAYLLWLAAQGAEHFTQAPWSLQALLALSGPVTAVPLLLFAAGARRIPFSTLGLLQYVAPTLQLLLGVWLFKEPFAGAKVAGYALVWSALAVFTGDSLWHAWRLRRAT